MAAKFNFKFNSIQKSSKKEKLARRYSRANLGGPDLQLLKDKINIITFITIKDRTIQTEFREGKEITSNTKKLTQN